MQPLRIETFSNAKGGNAFYKAVTHPKTASAARDLLRRLAQAGKVATAEPRLGEHTRAILAEHGFSAEEIEALVGDGAVLARE